ncbi:MAG: DUF2232 domain-containing protein [Rhodospirillaceae bacterium]|jgi:hypothetical protein|nr:DUF2232 domain-containing protein [Rhodospirillaceae bacterium]MBT6117236.1 DUF2232 domain-containing protein [Rhodospirillaceae bacterium]
MTRDAFIAAAAGLLSALLLTTVATGAPGMVLFALFSQVPIFVVGLGLGSKLAVVAAASGLVVTGIYAGAFTGAFYLVVFAGPAVILSAMALRHRQGEDGATIWYPADRLLGWIVVMAAVALAAIWLDASDAEGGLRGIIERLLADVVQQMPESPLRESMTTWFDVVAPRLPAIMATAWVVLTAANGALGQWAARRLGRALRPAPDFADIQAPGWAFYALAAAAAIGLLIGNGIGFLGGNLAPLFAIPFFFVGLAVVHAYARRSQARGMVLAVFYMLLIMLGFVAMVIVAVLGIAESFANWRQRLQRPSTT